MPAHRRESPSERNAFVKVRRAASQYAAKLRRIARHVGHLVNEYDPTDPAQMATLQDLLDRYAKFIEPWARAVGAKMIAEVSRRDAIAWAAYTRRMGRAIRAEVAGSPDGLALREMLDRQVVLITSLPIEAGQRVHRLTMQGLSTAARHEDISKLIYETGHVTESRANLIARTETARTASNFTEARSKAVGSIGYIWRTVGDGRVRELHEELNGKFIKWDEPPIAGEAGERAHAGCIYNCRCWPEPIFPEDNWSFSPTNSGQRWQRTAA